MKLLVGIGNTMRQDDGLGWIIASQLASYYADSDVMVICTHQLLPEIAVDIAHAQCVVFVDASIEGQAGCVQVQEIAPANAMTAAHSLNPPETLYLAKTLYGCHPPATLVTLTGASFELGDDLSAVVRAAIPLAITAIQQILSGDESSRGLAQPLDAVSNT